MADMLVRLYALPEPAPALERAKQAGVTIRRPDARERAPTVDWVRSTFSDGWAAECENAFCSQPPRCFIAVRDGSLIGFACHDCTRRNFFGPVGIAEGDRSQGVGAALTLTTLAAMRDRGYAYAIIGGVGPADFYAKVAGATAIDGSTPGIYAAVLSQAVEKGAGA